MKGKRYKEKQVIQILKEVEGSCEKAPIIWAEELRTPFFGSNIVPRINWTA